MSGKMQEVDEITLLQGKTWWEMRPTMVQMPASTWASFKKFIIKTCKANKNQCDKSVASWDRTVKTIDEKVELKLP